MHIYRTYGTHSPYEPDGPHEAATIKGAAGSYGNRRAAEGQGRLVTSGNPTGY